MSWLSEYVRPKFRTLLGRREVPDNLWIQCPSCQQMLFTRDLERNLKVCPNCGHHMRPTAQERLGYTFDEAADGTPGFTRIELPRVPADPLKFRDSKRYTDRLKEARDKTGLDDACVVAHGTIGGHRAVVAAMAFEFMGGSMGAAVGEAIVAAARPGRAAGRAADRVHRQRRRADAGGCDQPDADDPHHHRVAPGEGEAAALHHRADRPPRPGASPRRSRCSATSRSRSPAP